VRRALPYLTPVGRVATEPWIAMTGRAGPLGSFPLAWDYNTRLDFGRTIEVDVDGVLQDCGMDEVARLALCVRTWTSASRIRTLLSRRDLASTGVHRESITVSIDGAGLAGTMMLETTLEMAADRDGGHPFSPHRLGTILWRETISTPLEGDGGLLPIAPTSFAANPRLPSNAAWYVSLDFGDWDAAAMGCLLVLVNTDKDLIEHTLSATDGDQLAATVSGSLAADIVGDVVAKALEDHTFPIDPGEREPDGDVLTLAGLVTGLLRSYLRRPGESDVEAFERLRRLRESDPSMYRAEVQQGVRYLRDEQ
jgi:hypothetical protein